jgi:uncharacterized protein (DUF362 family)
MDEVVRLGKIVSMIRSSESDQGIKEALAKALTLTDFRPEAKVRSVVIKPNLCYYWNSSTGYTTDPRVVEGIIDWVREEFGPEVDIKIAEADATAMKTKYVFRMLGFEELAEKKKVSLFNLSEDKLIERKVNVGKREITYSVPSLLLNSDLFINVHKLKIMRRVKITCAMKNIFGCIAAPRKFAYHPYLEEAIVGINKILHPNLTIVDGIVALGKHPAKLNLIMASTDVFSIDWVASQTMGYRPSQIKFLKIARKESVGNSAGILVQGDKMSDFARIFPKEPMFSVNRFWNVLLRVFKLYTKLAKDVIHPSLEGV